MPTTRLRAISAPTLQRFNAALPPGERSRLVERGLQQALTERESELEKIAANFLDDPANSESLADEALWDVAAADGLDSV